MNKTRTMMFLQGMLAVGMVYALLAILVMPAAACTPSQCNNLQTVAPSLCSSFGGSNCTNVVNFQCNANGFSFTCEDNSGRICYSDSGHC